MRVLGIAVVFPTAFVSISQLTETQTPVSETAQKKSILVSRMVPPLGQTWGLRSLPQSPHLWLVWSPLTSLPLTLLGLVPSMSSPALGACKWGIASGWRERKRLWSRPVDHPVPPQDSHHLPSPASGVSGCSTAREGRLK